MALCLVKKHGDNFTFTFCFLCFSLVILCSDYIGVGIQGQFLCKFAEQLSIHSASYPMGEGLFPPGVNWLEREADHSPRSSKLKER